MNSFSKDILIIYHPLNLQLTLLNNVIKDHYQKR